MKSRFARHTSYTCPNCGKEVHQGEDYDIGEVMECPECGFRGFVGETEED